MVSPEKPLQWWVRCFSPPTLFAFSNYQNHAPGKLLTHQKSNSLTTLCANCSYFLAPHSLPCKHACAHSHTFQTHSHLLSFSFPVTTLHYLDFGKVEVEQDYEMHLQNCVISLG